MGKERIGNGNGNKQPIPLSLDKITLFTTPIERSLLTVIKKLDKVRLYWTICPINFDDLKIKLSNPIIS